jgi:hypothetical protein
MFPLKITMPATMELPAADKAISRLLSSPPGVTPILSTHLIAVPGQQERKMQRAINVLMLMAPGCFTLAGTAYAPAEEERRSLWTLIDQPWIYQG